MGSVGNGLSARMTRYSVFTICRLVMSWGLKDVVKLVFGDTAVGTDVKRSVGALGIPPPVG